MQRVIFQSLYADPGFSSLKHALFYFGKLRIPKNTFIIAQGEVCRWVMLAPEHVQPHLEFLEKEGCIEFAADEADPKQLYELIVKEADNDRPRIYRPADVAPVFGFLDVHPSHPEAPAIFPEFTTFLAAVVLQGVALGRGLPCVDNRVLFDLMNYGLKAIFESFIHSAGFSPTEVQSLKDQYLGQRLVSLFLPSFEFKSFEDVLEARERTRDQLANLHGRVAELASQVTAMPWEPGFESELGRLIRRQVEPEIETLRKSAGVSLAGVARQMGVAGAVVTMQSLLPEVLAQWLIGASVVSLVDAFKREREKARQAQLTNAFSLLLQVPF